MSSFRSHRDAEATVVGVQLAQSDIDNLHAGIPVDIQAHDDAEPVTSIHIAKDRRANAAHPLSAVPDTGDAEWHSI